MPRVSAFYGIVIYMYIRDLGVGHIHGWYGDDRSVFDIATGALIAGSPKAPAGFPGAGMDRSP